MNNERNDIFFTKLPTTKVIYVRCPSVYATATVNIPVVAVLTDCLVAKCEFTHLLAITPKDNAHGFGVMGPNGRGTSEHYDVMDKVDLYFGAFAKSMAAIGGFVSGPKEIINYLRYNLRSQIYAKSLPMAFIEGCLKRLDMIRKGDDRRKKLFTITRALQDGLRKRGFDIGVAEACITPVFLKGSLAEATNILVDLRETYKIFCSVVVYPVVPKGVIMYRLIHTAMHEMEHVEYTLNAFK